MKDTLGDRMKEYENINRNNLMKNSDVIIRLDWKAFHTFTRWLDKPFDIDLITTFQNVVKLLAKQISWFKLAYIQSDEISIWINDTDTIQTQWRFDYNINKINSVCASLCTWYFNKLWNKSDKIANFDCRCFNIPRDEIVNYFLWRQKDWYRNSVQMYARSIFSQNELQWKKMQEMKDMLFNNECDWDELDQVFKNWTYILQSWLMFEDIRPSYENLKWIIEPLYIINKD